MVLYCNRTNANNILFAKITDIFFKKLKAFGWE